MMTCEGKMEQEKVSFVLRYGNNKELQLMDILDQVMEHFHGVGVGTPLVNGDETKRAIERMNEKWLPQKRLNIKI